MIPSSSQAAAAAAAVAAATAATAVAAAAAASAAKVTATLAATMMLRHQGSLYALTAGVTMAMMAGIRLGVSASRKMSCISVTCSHLSH